VLLSGLLLLPCAAAHANTLTYLNTAAEFAVLSFDNVDGTPQFSFNGPSTIAGATGGNIIFSTGDVGIGAGVKQNWASPAMVMGSVYLDSLASGSSNSGVTASGGFHSADLSQPKADALNAYNHNILLTPNAIGGNLGDLNHNGVTTVTATAPDHINVFSVTGINYTGTGDQLVISGDINDYFVFNVSGDVKFSNAASPAIKLVGNVSPNHILFDVGGDLTMTNSLNYFGTFLVPTGDISVHDGTLVGELIGGGNISITSGFDVRGAPFVPLPASIGGGLALLALLGLSRRGKQAV
jgi:hypothetical protein